MGVLLNKNLVWAPKQAISSAFFEDILDLIKTKKRYAEISNEIEESITFYTYTLDYRNKSREQVILFFELVNVLIFSFDDIYKSRLEEEIILVYKASLIELRESFFKILC